MIRALALALALSLSIPSVYAESWVPFQVPDGSLTTQMPTEPKYREETVGSPVGDIKEHLYTSTVEDGHYTVEQSKLPWKAVHFASDQHIYRNAKGDLLKDVMGKDLSFKKIQTKGVDGMEVTYEAPAREGHPGYNGTAHMYLVGQAFYLLNVMVSKETPKSRTDPFFEELTIKKS